MNGIPALVADGVFQLQIPISDNPPGYLLVYYLPGPYGDTLIDAGWNMPTAQTALARQIASAGGSLRDIRQVVITHCHPDHAGLAEYVRSTSGAKLIMHRRENKIGVLRRENPLAMLQQVDAWLAKNGAPVIAQPLAGDGKQLQDLFPGKADLLLDGDETLVAGKFFLQVIHTPGHSPGHVCLFEPQQRLLFAGDHVLPGITPNVSLEPGFDNPLADYLNSLGKVGRLPARLVLPAHEHAFTNMPGRIEEIIAHHRARSAEVLENLDLAGSTAYQVARKVRWAVGSFDGLGAWDKRMAILEILSHLEFARLKGQVEIEERRNVNYFLSA